MGVYCYLCFTTNKQKQKLPYVQSTGQIYDNFGNSPLSLNRKTWFRILNGRLVLLHEKGALWFLHLDLLGCALHAGSLH